MRLPLILAALLAAAPAAAAEYDVPWYVARPAEREEALRRCRDDHGLARTRACKNAETAANRVYARQLRGAGSIYDRRWWAADPSRRLFLETNCRPGAPYSPTTRFCHLL